MMVYTANGPSIFSQMEEKEGKWNRKQKVELFEVPEIKETSSSTLLKCL